MNMARARRRWTAWDRYAHRCDRIGGGAPDWTRAVSCRYRLWLRKQERQRLRASAVDIADLLARLDRSRAAA